MEQLDLLGDPADIRLTRAVHDEIRDKPDEVAVRVAKLGSAMPPIVDHVASQRVDPTHFLGRGERRVLRYARTTGGGILCVLDDSTLRHALSRVGEVAPRLIAPRRMWSQRAGGGLLDGSVKNVTVPVPTLPVLS